jgi:hypothetical protein
MVVEADADLMKVAATVGRTEIHRKEADGDTEIHRIGMDAEVLSIAVTYLAILVLIRPTLLLTVRRIPEGSALMQSQYRAIY